MDNTGPSVLIINKPNSDIVPPRMAWNLPPSQPVLSLNDVMSEELAKQLVVESHDEFTVKVEEVNCLEEENVNEELDFVDPDCANDLLLAQTLQNEFDKEHDQILALEERKFNGSSKVSISFKNYRKTNEVLESEDDSDDGEVRRDWDSFEKAERTSPAIGKNGISKRGNVITTKHDATICGQRNACRVMEFPPGFETGDGGGFDMKLSNRVYNRLKIHSLAEEKRRTKFHDKVEKSTAVQALDPKTRLILFKLIDADILETVNGIVSTGKEAAVLHAVGGKSTEFEVPVNCAIKVYKTTLNEFKTREKYMRDDFRFKDHFQKQNPRKLVKIWAEKEMFNLKRLKKADIRCPQVVVLKKHVLVMSFIGKDQVPAQKLKDADLTMEELQAAHDEIIEIMKKMYVKCQLVHSDMSEYNVLWHENHPVIIDVSQSVDTTDPHALEFLLRDCVNILKFFGKRGLNVVEPNILFRDICGMELGDEGPEILQRMKDYERNEEILTHDVSDKPYPFDNLFKQQNE
ncbi:hypothetical protein CHUAL_008658 [Chamberlinius hualienensis]